MTPIITQVAPTRLLETRGAGGVSQPVATGSVTRVRAMGVAGVPAAARGVAINVTAVNPRAAGFLSVYPCDQARPNTSNQLVDVSGWFTGSFRAS